MTSDQQAEDKELLDEIRRLEDMEETEYIRSLPKDISDSEGMDKVAIFGI